MGDAVMSDDASESPPHRRDAAPATAAAPSVDRARLGHRLLFVGVLVLAAALRLWRLDSVPPAINQDEAVHAYDAWCIGAVGTDHYGTPWPIFFRAFGDYHPGPFIYLLVPLERLFGMTIWTARLPGALIGVLGVGLMYAAVRRRYGHRVGLLSALMLAISPWHLHVNRLAFEAGACPTLLLLGLLSGLAAVDSCRRDDSPGRPLRTAVRFAASGLVFGLASWFYHAMRVFVPLLLVAAGVVYRRELRSLLARSLGRRGAMSFLAGITAGLAPFAIAWVRSPEHVWARALHVAASRETDGGFGIAAEFVRNYLRNLSPDFLFVRGDFSPIQSVPGFGQLLPMSVIFLPLGLFHVLRRRREEPFGLLLVAWWLLAPVPAALAVWPTGHALRSIAAVPALAILEALGVVTLMEFARSFSPAVRRGWAVAVGLVIVANAAGFLRLFFGAYPMLAAPAFQTEWRAIADEVAAREDDYSVVVLTTRAANQPGILYQFWRRTDPRVYFAGPHEIQRTGLYDQIALLDKVVFWPAEKLPLLAEVVRPAGRVLVVERPGAPVPGRELKRVHWPDGREAAVLYDVPAERLGESSVTTGETPVPRS